MGNKSHKKGRALEDVVEMIERTILQTDPSLAGRTIRVQPRKRLTIDGVRMEVDLWVELLGANGYDSLFLFECKNWEHKVGKNEVALFADKIAATKAQRGFMLARSFASTAVARAKLDPRIRIHKVRAEEYERLQLPLRLHYVLTDKWDVQVILGCPDAADQAGRVDVEHAKAVIDGASPTSFIEYLNPWVKALVEESVGRFPTITSPTGTYKTEGEAERRFKRGELLVDGHGVASVTLKVFPTFRVVWPTIVSSVEVEGRGLVVTLESVPAGDGEIRGALVAVSDGEKPAESMPRPPKETRKRAPRRAGSR